MISVFSILNTKYLRLAAVCYNYKNTMSRGTKATVVIASVLAVMAIVFARLNYRYVAPKANAQEAGVFFISAGEQEFPVTMDDLIALSPSDIRANYKPSGRKAETRTYQGVSLKTVIESLSIDYSGYKSVLFIAADGYASTVNLIEAMDDEGCYIVISHDGNPLGSKESGGVGPIMMILPNDRFSMRWCKFLLEAKLQ